MARGASEDEEIGQDVDNIDRLELAADSRSDSAIVREEANDASQIAGSDLKSANEFAVRRRRLEGLVSLERDEIVLVLAQILMQAAGLSVEELDDDKR